MAESPKMSPALTHKVKRGLSAGRHPLQVRCWKRWPIEDVFTRFRRRLKLIAHDFAPADGVNVWRVVVHPLIELILPTIKVDEQQAAHTPLHRGDAHKAGLHQVYRLQFHVGGKAVAGVVLTCRTHLNPVLTGFRVASCYNNC